MVDVKLIFGNNIKLLRQNLNLSQELFCEKIEVSTATLSSIESGKNFTTSETINNICNTFSVSASVLFEADSNFLLNSFGKRKQVVSDISLMLNNLDDDKLFLCANIIQMLSDSNINVEYKKSK